MTALDLSENQIDELSALQALKQLRTLNLAWNQINDESVSELQKLKQLTTLNLEGNQITDVLNLSQLPRLEKLDISENSIQNIPVEVLDKGIDAIREYQKKQHK